VVPHELSVRRQGAPGHGRPGNEGLDRQGFRRDVVLRHAIPEDELRLHHPVHIDVQLVVRSPEGMPHDRNIGLAGSA